MINNYKDKYILNSLKELELSPTMEKNARDKYSALCNYLTVQGLDSDFQPQGSFLIGTVIKPYKDGKNRDYDLDVLAILKRNKKETTAEKVKNDVGDLIKKSGIYADKLKKEDRNCWTLEYAEDSNGITFLLDIVPAVDEMDNIKNELFLSGGDNSKIEKTLSITDKNVTYNWLTTNPLGFGDWFLEISNKYLTNDIKTIQYKNLPIDITINYRYIEDIPNYFYKSNLQSAVQFVKRHRDIYYDRIKKTNEKPSSILVSSLIADSVKDEMFLSIEEIIRTFIRKYNEKTISIMKDEKIFNPVDLRQNLIEGYIPSRISDMNKWILELKKIINIENEKEFRKAIHNNINDTLYRDDFGEIEYASSIKPWGK